MRSGRCELPDAHRAVGAGRIGSPPGSVTNQCNPTLPLMADIRPKQRAFVDEYLVDFNATQAAVRAGYSVKTAA